MRLLVCAGRDFDDEDLLYDIMQVIEAKAEISCIIEGGAKGADMLAGLYANFRNLPLEIYPAQWEKYGNQAGPIRNMQMIVEGKPDCVLALPGGRGTANMVQQAKDAGIRVIERK